MTKIKSKDKKFLALPKRLTNLNLSVVSLPTTYNPNPLPNPKYRSKTRLTPTFLKETLALHLSWKKGYKNSTKD
jgi:hypothetical protein